MSGEVEDELTIVLASASPRRAELLKLIGLKYKVIPSNEDEDLPDHLAVSISTPEAIVKYLAMKKAKIVADSFKNSVNSYIIGADTVVVIEGRILGKPADASDAYEMLKSLSGNWHDVYTGIAVVKINSGIVTSRSEYEKTRVKIADITDEEIYNYINTGEPMDKAGAYGIQGIGALIVEKIEGCYFNVMGLPIYKLSRLLSTMGIELSLIVNKRGRNEGTVKA